MMQATEMSDYINSQFRSEPRRGQEKGTHQTERRLCNLLFLSFGLLCMIHATLNVSLRLFLFSSEERESCNMTECGECGQVVGCKTFETKFKSLTAQHNSLQDRFNALKRDNSLLQNKISELNNMKMKLQEERDRLIRQGGSDTASPNVCPLGWKEINSRCYFLSTEAKTWAASRKDCKRRGADLVIINSKQEQMDLYLPQDRNLFWIGLSDSSGSFNWVDGSPLGESFWQLGQPSGAGPHQQEDCVEVYQNDPVLANWNDAPCGSSRRWMCEMSFLEH
ncbi:C-type lectin domain family 4 member D-like [Genypterus blacodes]|uniref:C-type lectin domain family 4 member D-like n=1 Tax=Genypterus blacodes TaxID=154954 RepID=UPI003F76CE04